MEIKLGKYRHFKGGIFEIIGIAKHTETEEVLVIYKHLDLADHLIWARPINMFLETVEKEGKRIPRFEYLD